MDLRNQKITFGEIMKNQQAASLLKKEFPQWADSPLMRMASAMPLSKVLRIAAKHVPQEKIDAVLSKLEQL